VTSRLLQTSELFEVEIGVIGTHHGVKQEVKQLLKGKESIRMGFTTHRFVYLAMLDDDDDRRVVKPGLVIGWVGWYLSKENTHKFYLSCIR